MEWALANQKIGEILKSEYNVTISGNVDMEQWSKTRIWSIYKKKIDDCLNSINWE